MVETLERVPHNDPPRRIKLDENSIMTKELPDFISINSRKLFVALDISQNFNLKEDPINWETNVDFSAAKRRVVQLKVVNDAAERGVALIQTFNGILSNQEEQKQFLLQVP